MLDVISRDGNGSLVPGGSVASRLVAGGMNVAALRSCDVLPKEAWVQYDNAVVMAGRLRQPGVGLAIQRGLVLPITNALGVTIVQWDEMTDLDPAQVSMDGRSPGRRDREAFNLKSVPLPIVHKDFEIGIRELTASQRFGMPLDTTRGSVAGRIVGEGIENLLFQGGLTFGGGTIYGFTTHPNRNTAGFGTNGNWGQAAKTGSDILADVLTMIGGLEADRHYGPFVLFIPGGYSTKMGADFKTESDKTIRQRLEEIDQLNPSRGGGGVVVSDGLPANNVVMAELTPETFDILDGFGPTTVNWETEGGMVQKMKVISIRVPRIKADGDGRSGVFHMS